MNLYRDPYSEVPGDINDVAMVRCVIENNMFPLQNARVDEPLVDMRYTMAPKQANVLRAMLDNYYPKTQIVQCGGDDPVKHAAMLRSVSCQWSIRFVQRSVHHGERLRTGPPRVGFKLALLLTGYAETPWVTKASYQSGGTGNKDHYNEKEYRGNTIFHGASLN